MPQRNRNIREKERYNGWMADAKPEAAPFFSVVIPAFNSARWIDEALASVSGQGRSDVEVIVVDDGSADDTAALVERHAGVRLIRQENQGPATARNRGLAAARGEWIAFLDADDRWRPGHLDRLTEAIRLYPGAGLIYTDAMVISPDGRELKPKDSPPLGPDPFRSLLLRNTVTTSCAAAPREALERAGGFSPSFHGPEDWDLWLRLARRYPVVRVPLITADSRRQEAGLVHTAGGRLLEQNLVIITRAASLEPRLSDRDLRRARANCLIESAVRRLSAGDARGARGELMAALRQRPCAGKVWALAVVSLGGAPAARALKKYWRRGERPVRATPRSRGAVATPGAGTEVPATIRVDFLITDSGVGGAEKMLSALIRGLDPARHRPRLIVLKPPGKTAEELKRAGVTVEWLGLPAGLGAAYALGLPAAAFRLWRLLRRDRPAILHCWLFQANLLGRVVGRLAGIPAVVSSLRVMEEER